MKVTVFIIAALSAVAMAKPHKPKKPETCQECDKYFEACHSVSSSSSLFMTV
jgi:hypothetical protein